MAGGYCCKIHFSLPGSLGPKAMYDTAQFAGRDL
jgi:hypothetical protein